MPPVTEPEVVYKPFNAPITLSLPTVYVPADALPWVAPPTLTAEIVESDPLGAYPAPISLPGAMLLLTTTPSTVA